jgi:hypothetical protein
MEYVKRYYCDLIRKHWGHINAVEGTAQEFEPLKKTFHDALINLIDAWSEHNEISFA